MMVVPIERNSACCSARGATEHFTPLFSCVPLRTSEERKKGREKRKKGREKRIGKAVREEGKRRG